MRLQFRTGKNCSLLTLSVLLFMLFYNFLILLTALLFVQPSKQMILPCDYREYNRYLIEHNENLVTCKGLLQNIVVSC